MGLREFDPTPSRTLPNAAFRSVRRRALFDQDLGSENRVGVSENAACQDCPCQPTPRNRFDYVDERMKKYEFWIYTAQVEIFIIGMKRADSFCKACRKLHNFSSTSAIVTTLLSPTIAKLTLTCDSKPAKQFLHGLVKQLADVSYRSVIENEGTKQLIPWLGKIGLILYYHYLTPTCTPIL